MARRSSTCSNGAEVSATPASINRAAEQHAVYYDLHAPSGYLGIEIGQGKLVTNDARAVKDGPVTPPATIRSSVWTIASSPSSSCPKTILDESGSASRTMCRSAPNGKRRDARWRRGRRRLRRTVSRSSLGLKTSICCARSIPKLQQLIDWGFFGIIAKPLFLALHWLNDNLLTIMAGPSS